uniref:DUF5615 domain-containing protein n=1 Tax=Candidatus Kentrum sp. DK TaxID=2126562 RepID=A0A450TI93_9GAMM|nr:MAG: hypothetical protein BECKDK2373B_GA0170837_11673 [Candidatus Kentron sp. DK]VFJ67004.1 MAG: hypothetical protein BECKDK2373C_GA0170839_11583 [Candidatus Kentron sp. DK]
MPSRNILLDECLDRKFADKITGYSAQTVAKAGWASFKNGNLLQRAQADFDIFITADRSLIYQQNLSNFDIAVIVLLARSNKVNDLLPFVPELLTAIPKAKPGAPLVLKRPPAK